MESEDGGRGEERQVWLREKGVVSKELQGGRGQEEKSTVYGERKGRVIWRRELGNAA